MFSISVPAESEFPLDTYLPVTDYRLLNPEPENWLQWRGNYQGWTYSPLEQINSDNVEDLRVAWVYSTDASGAHQAPPIVNNGYMFVTTPEHQVIALNARSGNELWRYKRELPKDHFAMHETNRGVALYKDKVYLSGLDTCAIALDAVSGKEIWKNCLANWRLGFHMTLAPLAVDGLVIFGLSGAEYGVRCFLVALDADTGKEVWRTYTIPEPGQPGSETWPDDTWRSGGGSVWVTGTYDADLKLAYFGIGNPAPWLAEMRKGDNLYTNSVLAIDVKTGTIRAHHQYHWNGAWDWDEVSPPLLIDIPDKQGKMKKGLVHAGRNGYLWFLERRKDKIKFVDAKAFVKQDVFTSIDPVTGRPAYAADKIPGIGKTATFCPSVWGGKDWPPEAYNPETGLFYIPAQENICSELTGTAIENQGGEIFTGYELDEILSMVRFDDEAFTGKDAHIGEIQAWDLHKREKVWTFNIKEMNWGSLLTTGGNLVFSGGSNDRKFRALDASSGNLLWDMRLNSGVVGVPVSYMIDGVQYIAVQSGWGAGAEYMQTAFNIERKNNTTVPRDGAIWVFALKDKSVAK
ncbi:MAG: PQQ-dependent dehydrogenase, methanol/ethanol family [Gammaproteobacteria bacterium]|nr:PQQ-dependent dehydrogenase, methanol/ethanol family [Gammaproteobacteria bacterium]